MKTVPIRVLETRTFTGDVLLKDIYGVLFSKILKRVKELVPEDEAVGTLIDIRPTQKGTVILVYRLTYRGFDYADVEIKSPPKELLDLAITYSTLKFLCYNDHKK
jgi:hypothetical protein